MNVKTDQLNSLLSSLQLATEFPTEILSLQLKNTIEAAKPYSGRWDFPWLLTPWESDVWKTANGVKTRKDVNDNWIDTSNIYWNALLPDGQRLTDPCYAKLLEASRKITALHRAGFATHSPPTVHQSLKFACDVLRLCDWLVLHKNQYYPAEQGFKLLDQAGVKRLLLAIAKGGWCEANRLIERCLTQLYLQVFNQPVPLIFHENPTRLPQDICDKIVYWLRLNNGFAKVNKVITNKVSRSLLAQLVNSDTNGLIGHDLLDLFLRQFETELKDDFILKPGYRKTEFPSHNTPMLDQIENQSAMDGTVRLAGKNLRFILTLYRHLPTELPSPAGINLAETVRVALTRSSGAGHTPFIPIDTGLKYLNEAMKWVVLYGDAIVEYFLLVEEKFQSKKNDWNNPKTFRYANKYVQKQVFAETPLPQVLKDAGFEFDSYATPFGKGRDFNRLRTKPSLEEAIRVLVGAVTITIGLLKPSREMEISTLPLDCLSRSPQGLYWLESKLGKRTQGGVHSSIRKPIPYVTAKAIQQMYKLNRGLVGLHQTKDQYKSGLLFYLPDFTKRDSAVKMLPSVLNKYLDSFCDYVGLPPDEYGRRWYLRIHEMRKWFLLLLFWSGRYDVLDAARWIAGHTDVKHLYEYIEREFPGSQLGSLEAECAVDQLAKYDETKTLLDGESVGLVELYQRVLSHFRVDSLSLVKESEWHLLVEELFEEEFHLEPYSISEEHGDRICVAIRTGARS